jgi:hypothetical protein
VAPTADAQAKENELYESRLRTLLAQYPLCAGVQLAAVPSPLTLAAEQWDRTPLPVPKPRIAPGRGVTGLDMYLELQIEMRPKLSADTLLGRVTYDVVGTATVDWGDDVRHQSFPPGNAGGPYPSGSIRHQWTNRGTYQVHVRVDWTATWHLAGGSGTLGGYHTEGDLTLPVIEIQASGCTTPCPPG